MNRSDNINIGQIIYNIRNERRMTQEHLAEGICSISYLSKIENDQSNSSDEILELLLEKLGFNIDDLYQNIHAFKHKLEKLSNLIDNKALNKASELYKEVNTTVNDIKDPTTLCNYYLIKLKYLISTNSLDKAKTTLDFINEFYKKKSDSQEFLFQNLIGVLCSKRKNYSEGLNHFKSAELLGIENKLNLSVTYYNLALTYSHLHNSSLAIYYAQNALRILQHDLNFLKSIDCQIIIGLNFVRIKNYNEAKSIYTKALEQAELFNNNNTKALILHNLGYLNYSIKDYDQAYYYYMKSLDYKKINTEDYLLTLYYLCKTLLDDSKKKEFLFWINKSFNIINEYPNLKKSEFSYLLKLMMLKVENYEEYLVYSENEAFPYFLSTENYTQVLNLGNDLADFYSSKRMYKKANLIYKEVIEIINEHY